MPFDPRRDDLGPTAMSELSPRQTHSNRASGADLPWWFDILLVIAIAAVLGCGGAGLGLAILGHYHLWSTAALGLPATAVLTALAWPHRRPGAVATLPTATMALISLAITVWNGLRAGHYVWVDRDPGVYATTGTWIAGHGSLEVPAGAGWSGLGRAFGWASAGMYPEPGGMLEFQFSHLTGVLLAEARSVGGDRLMFALPAVLGGLALCAVYAVGVRLVQRPWLCVAATTAVGVSLPELAVSRDTYSETSAQLLLWGGLWLLLCTFRQRSVRTALVAGIAIGGVLMSRIDAVVYFVPLPVLAALVWLARPARSDRGFLLRSIGAVVTGALPPIVLATVDETIRATGYYTALHLQVSLLRLGFAGAAAIALMMVVIWPRVTRIHTITPKVRETVAYVLAGAVATGLLLAWTVRPAVMAGHMDSQISTTATLQQAEGLAADPSRTYSELTMVWMSWYVGPIVLLLAIIGIVILIVRFVRDGDGVAGLILAVAGLGTLMYLVKPDITPEQIWASRRFVPAAIPFLLLASATTVDVLLTTLGPLLRHARTRTAATAAAAGVLLVFPISSTLPVRSFSSQEGYLPLVDATCKRIGPHAAVLFAKDDIEKLTLLQTMRGYCDATSAQVSKGLRAAEIDRAAASWKARGRDLWVVGSNPTLVRSVAPGLRPLPVGTAISRHNLEKTLSRYPSRYATQTLSIFTARVVPTIRRGRQ